MELNVDSLQYYIELSRVQSSPGMGLIIFYGRANSAHNACHENVFGW